VDFCGDAREAAELPRGRSRVLVVGAQLGERTLHSIELFGAKVLPRMREL